MRTISFRFLFSELQSLKMDTSSSPSSNKRENLQSPTYQRQSSYGDQLLVFRDAANPRIDFDQLSRLLGGSLDAKEQACLADLKEYLVMKEDAWILDVKLLNFVGALLEHRQDNKSERMR